MRIALYVLIIFIYTFDYAAFHTVATKSKKHSKVKHLLAKHNHRNKSVSISSSSGKPALAFVFSTTSNPSKDVPIKLTATQNLSKDGVKKKQRYLRKERAKLRKLLKNKKNHYNSEEATSILSKINQINDELKKYGSKYGKKRKRIKKPMNYSKKTNSNADILEITTAQNKNFVFKWSLKNDTLNKVISKLNKDPGQNIRSHSFNAQSDGFSPTTTVETIQDKTFKSFTSNLLKSKSLEHNTNVRNISITTDNKVNGTKLIKMEISSISSPQNDLSDNDLYNTTESSKILEDNVPNINYADLMTIQSTTMPPIKNLSLVTILNEFNAISDQMNDVLPGTNIYHKINMTRKAVMKKNINRCSIRKGGCEHICRPRGPNKCICMPGFRLSGNRRNCVDIDECKNSNGGCKGICKNTPGSYYCACPTGLRLSDDKISCEDINECLLRNGHGPCQDTCINSYGSYECSCSALIGTRLSTDKHSCEDINECFDNRIQCSHNCVNTLGRAYCTCPEGMVLGEDWKTCIDIDECEDEEIQKQCKHGCMNLIGSYRCIESYEFQSDQTLFSISDYIACPKLLPPKHGFLECSRDKVLEIKAKTKSGRRRITNRPGTFCQLICPGGYKTIGKYKLTCGFDGEWFGEKMGKCTRHHL